MHVYYFLWDLAHIYSVLLPPSLFYLPPFLPLNPALFICLPSSLSLSPSLPPSLFSSPSICPPLPPPSPPFSFAGGTWDWEYLGFASPEVMTAQTRLNQAGWPARAPLIKNSPDTDIVWQAEEKEGSKENTPQIKKTGRHCISEGRI